MIVYAFYESDTRVMQYARALVQRGDIVDVLALKRDDTQPQFEVLNGVNVYRIQSRTRNERGLLDYAGRILSFFFRSARILGKMHYQLHYDLVHVHNVPDLLVFAAIIPRLHGVPVILDIHDLLPEFYASKFKVPNTSPVFKLMTMVERFAAAFATHIIVANHLWRDRLAARSAQPKKCSVVRNYPDTEIFAAAPAPRREKKDKLLLIYPGTLNSHQGLDVAIRAFALIASELPEAEFHIYGEGSAKASLVDLASELKLEGRVIFHDFLPSREIARVMAESDLAIEPKRATSAFGNEALSTKILEFMVLGIPIVASKTKTHALYYDHSVVRYYHQDDERELAAAMLRFGKDPALRREQANRASAFAQQNTWQARKEEYLRLVDGLVRAH